MKRLNLRRYILIIRELQIDPRFSHACQFESMLNKVVFFLKNAPCYLSTVLDVYITVQ